MAAHKALMACVITSTLFLAFLIVRMSSHLSSVEAAIRSDVSTLALRQNSMDTAQSNEPTNSLPEDSTEFHTKTDAVQAVEKLGETPDATKLAQVLAEVDTWIVKPNEEQEFHTYKVELAKHLRKQVKSEVAALQKASLSANTSTKAVEKHSEAGRILSLYPMSEDEAVLEEAKELSHRQAEVAARIESIRRQRYNQWAVTRIEMAIDGYNKNASYLSPKKENPVLVKSLVTSLGEVDPSLVEPVVLDLYSYAIGLTKDSISEADKLDLAKKLAEPAIHRKTLGDF